MKHSSQIRQIVLIMLALLMSFSSATAADLTVNQNPVQVTFEDSRSVSPAVTEEPQTEEPATVPDPEPFIPVNSELVNAGVGDLVEFGEWFQQIESGKTPLIWIVTDISGNEMTLISLYVLELGQYHDLYAKTTWEASALRKRLNKDFIYAFSSEEKDTIIEVETASGVQDRVWIPSAAEWEGIRNKTQSLLLGATKRAGSTLPSDISKVDGWWLRQTEGKSSRTPWADYTDGSVNEAEVDLYGGIRPMIRIRFR